MNIIPWKTGTFSCLRKEKSILWLETTPSRSSRAASRTDFQLMWMTGAPTALGGSAAGLISTSRRFSSAYAPFSAKCSRSKLIRAQPGIAGKYRELPKAPSLQKFLGKRSLSTWGGRMGHCSSTWPDLTAVPSALAPWCWFGHSSSHWGLQQGQCWGRESCTRGWAKGLMVSRGCPGNRIRGMRGRGSWQIKHSALSLHKEYWQMCQCIPSCGLFLLRCLGFQSWCFKCGLCETSPECQQTDISLQQSTGDGKLLGEILCYWAHPALFSVPEQPCAGVHWCVWTRGNCT